MWRTSCFVLLAALLAGRSQAQSYHPNGDGGDGIGLRQPSLQWARARGSTKFDVILQVSKPVYETVEYQYTVLVTEITSDGKEVCRPETRTATRQLCKMVSVQKVLTLGPQAQFFELDGRRVEPAVAARRLREPTLVLVSADNNMVPNYYTHLFKAGTLVVAGPLDGGQTPAASPPAPATHPSALANETDDASAPVFRPRAPAPLLRFARLDDKRILRLREFYEQTTSETVSQPTLATTVQQQGSGEFKIRRVRRVNDTLEMAVSQARVTMANGTAIGEVGLDSLLKRETAILVSADGQQVDPLWLTCVKPTTLVVQHPAVGLSCDSPTPPHYGPRQVPVPQAMPVPTRAAPSATPVVPSPERAAPSPSPQAPAPAPVAPALPVERQPLLDVPKA